MNSVAVVDNTTSTVKNSQGTVLSVTLIPSTSAGTFIMKDGGATGTIVIAEIDTLADGQGFTIPIAHTSETDGLRCLSDIYVDLSNCQAVIVYS